MSAKSLVFLHISDIHFNTSAEGVFDLDSDIRNELERDIESVMGDSRYDFDKCTGIRMCNY